MIKLIITIILTLTSFFANAQLKGSGKTVTKTYNFQNFNKVNFDDLDGKLEIEVGKPYSISVTIDDNLLPLFILEENNSKSELKVFFKNNANNKKYIEDTHLKITILMPKLTEIKHTGNSSLIISNLSEMNFKLENSGNGTTTVIGKVETLKVVNSGNGNTKAKELFVKNAAIKCAGNGNVYLNVSDELTAKATGNCTVFNFGKAKFDLQSSKSGNANLVYKF